MKRARLTLAAAFVSVLAFGAVWSARAAASGPALPGEFRSWMHVKSMVVTDPGHGMYGFHDVYGNKLAIETLRSPARPVTYREGATFVVSIREVVTSGGMINAGAKRRDVMKVKDRTAVSTGGWRFAAFDPAGAPIAIDPVADCYGCHARAKDADLVFSTFTE